MAPSDNSPPKDSMEELLRAVARTPEVTPHLTPGSMVDHFKVTRMVGSGGMAEVYQARDTKLGRKVALKVLHPGALGGRQSLDRFLLEAHATAKFSHPHITAIHAVGEAAGRPYVALEFLDGQSLRERMTQETLGGQEVLRIGLAVAEALGEAHRQGVFHRDLKPENVMLPRDGRLRVVDFGLAKLVTAPRGAADPQAARSAETATESNIIERLGSRDSRVCGTPPYMSPEQWGGKEVSGATDIWSLGVVLHELVYGCRPYVETNPLQVALQVCSAEQVVLPPLPRRRLPAGLAEVVGECLNKDPAARPLARDVIQRLQSMLHSGQGPVGQDECPFRGLLPFDEIHRGLFFGRDDEVGAFMERARLEPILSVVGPSGAGKSSFVQAGIVPRLRERGAMVVIRLRPGERPFVKLATRLIAAQRQVTSATRSSPFGGPVITSEAAAKAPSAEDLVSRGGQESEVELLAQQLEASPRLLNVRLHRLAERSQRGVLLFVDQLEELHTMVPDEQVRGSFMRAICTAADDPELPVRVILTLREEFLGRLAAGSGVRAAFSHITVMRRPGADTLAETLLRPVAAVGYAFDDPEMVSEMVRAVASEASCLPLLQFAGQLLWERRDRQKKLLLRSAHDTMGGVVGALAQHADGVLTGLSSEEVALARTLLLRMVTPQGTRRVLPRSRLLEGLPAQDAARVLDRLTDARLVAGRKAADHAEAELELVHESLVQTWTRLRRWIDESREELVLLAEMEQATDLWQRRGKRDAEVWHEEALRDARRALDRGTLEVPRQVEQFLEAGERVANRTQRRRRLQLAAGFGLLALVALGAVAAALVLSSQKQVVERERRVAEHQRAATQREGAQAALAQGRLLEARAKLRGSLETLDSTASRVLWWRLANDALIWRRDSIHTSYSLEHSPDGELLATTAIRQVILLDTVTAQVARTLRGHRDQVFCAAFSDDGRQVASGARDGEVIVWDRANGRILKRLTGHTGAVHAVRFLPGGRLASGARDHTIRLWDIKSGQAEVLRGHTCWIFDLRLSPDGKTLASGSCDKTAKLWDLASRRPTKTFRGFDKWIVSLDFSPDGRHLAAAHGPSVRLIDLASGATIANYRGHSKTIRAVRFSPRGDLLATGSRDLTTHLLQVPSLRRTRLLSGHQGAVYALTIHPGGRSLVSGGKQGIMRRDLKLNRQLPKQRGHRGQVERVAFSPDNKTIMSMATDLALRMWDVASGDQTQLIGKHTSAIRDARFSSDGKSLITAHMDSTARIWRLGPNTLPRLLRGHNSGVRCAAFSPDDARVATGSSDYSARVWDAASGNELVQLKGHTGAVYDLDFSPDGETLATASEDGSVRLWDTASGRQVRKLAGHTGRVVSVRFSPDGETLASGDIRGSLRLWRAADGTGRELARFSSRIYWLDFHPDGKHLGVPLADGTARIISTTPGAPAKVLRGHRADVNTVRFSPDGALAATSSDDGTLRLWRADSGAMFWRGPLLQSDPPRLFSHRGWIDLEAGGGQANPAASQGWRGAVENRALLADISADGARLCLIGLGGVLEQWDIQADRRLLSRTRPDLVDVLAMGDACATRAASGEVVLHRADDKRVLVAGGATALAVEGAQLLLAVGRKVQAHPASGRPAWSLEAEQGISAMARRGQTLFLGYIDGSLEAIDRGDAAGARRGGIFEQLPSSPIERLLPGPRDILFAGFANGEVGIWSSKTGKRLYQAKMHGPARHLLYRRGKLYAATLLGDHLVLDLGVLEAEYCALMRQLWSRVPVLWHEGRPVKRPPPAGHRCAKEGAGG